MPHSLSDSPQRAVDEEEPMEASSDTIPMQLQAAPTEMNVKDLFNDEEYDDEEFQSSENVTGSPESSPATAGALYNLLRFKNSLRC